MRPDIEGMERRCAEAERRSNGLVYSDMTRALIAYVKELEAALDNVAFAIEAFGRRFPTTNLEGIECPGSIPVEPVTCRDVRSLKQSIEGKTVRDALAAARKEK